MKNYRPLTDKEIATLETRGCSSPDWGEIRVADGFSPLTIRNVRIVNCNIGEDVYINNVFGQLCNLDIAPGAYIEAVYSIVCTEGATFGFGHRVNVMSETGGRPVMLTEALSAQMAYIQAFYRHSALLSKKIDEMAEGDIYRPEKGPVGRDARIVNCGSITNVWIGEGCRLEGVSKLSEGFVDKASLGPDVIARNFIIQQGARVTDGAHLNGVFVGECVTISGAMVHDSLIFANSQVENGEVVASFLGPFTTTMHKSTLLIGGLFSFFNAGSGSNQSNHAYKLGPMHQGITQRGCKTGSDSYILWPAAFGAFTTILGRHYGHPDTRQYPFSIILNDKEGRSILLPGAAAATVGFARDVDKWPKRDGRDNLPHCSAPFPFLDLIDYHWLSPFTVEECLKGLSLLSDLRGKEQPGMREFTGFAIPERAVEKGIRIYKLLIIRYMAETLLKKIQSTIAIEPQFGVDEILQRLNFAVGDAGDGHWVDIAGMLAPKKAVDRMLEKFVEGTLTDDASQPEEPDVVMARDLFENYNSLNWSWLQHNLTPLIAAVADPQPSSASGSELPSQGDFPCRFSAAMVADILKRGAAAIEEMTRLWEADAAKEFDPEIASLGFGIDAYENRSEILDDFARSRGSLAGNKFLAMNQRSTKETAARMRMIADILTRKNSKN